MTRQIECRLWRGSRSSTGFTLIELLVVVAIIGLLIGMLLPTLNSARETSRISKCMANQKQIGLASFVYAQDNLQVLVPWVTSSYFVYNLDPYLGADSSQWITNAGYIAAGGSSGGLNQFDHPNYCASMAWCCPSNMPTIIPASSLGGVQGFNDPGAQCVYCKSTSYCTCSGYGTTGYYNQTKGGLSPYNVTTDMIPRASEKAFYVETRSAGNDMGEPAFVGAAYPSQGYLQPNAVSAYQPIETYFHKWTGTATTNAGGASGQCNILFADAHSRTVNASDPMFDYNQSAWTTNLYWVCTAQ